MTSFIQFNEFITKVLDSDLVSKITDINKPFELDILPEEIGLIEMKVHSSAFSYKNNTHNCSLRKLNIMRNFSMNDNFNSLNQYEKDLILNQLIPTLKEQFTHIYKIIEIRNKFIVNGYVDNNINYMCYGKNISY